MKSESAVTTYHYFLNLLNRKFLTSLNFAILLLSFRIYTDSCGLDQGTISVSFSVALISD